MDKERSRFSNALNELVDAAVADPVDAGATLLRLTRRLATAVGGAKAVRQEKLGYREAIAFFVTNRDKARASRKGAILRRRQNGRQLIRLLFLDDHDEVLAKAPTKTYLVDEVDAELTEAFGAHDLVVVT